jgi:PKHD-type hydroxylase
MIYEIDLLDDDNLKYIISHYTKNNFIDGSISNPSSSKKNMMMRDCREYRLINKYCNEILISNSQFRSVFLPKEISQIYYLWYDIGMKYDYHIDNYPIGGVNSHYSMTCFLSDPKDYSGGELVLKVGNKELEYKLEPGKAVIYSTGIKHKVNPVTSGDRKVFVCWIESCIQNSFIRNHLIDYGNVVFDMKINDNKIENASDVLENLEQLRVNLIREYGSY